MTKHKSNAKEIAAMKRTQPKMVRVINGLKGGKGRMMIEEESEINKEKRGKA
jgi:hypothetical protein